MIDKTTIIQKFISGTKYKLLITSVKGYIRMDEFV